MTSARTQLTWGEFKRLTPEAQRALTRAWLDRLEAVGGDLTLMDDPGQLQRECQKDYDEEIADQYLGCARED